MTKSPPFPSNTPVLCSQTAIRDRVAHAEHLWLFLDYDGTLADFAPNPDVILPDEEVESLVAALAKCRGVRVSVISGRRLAHVQRLVPVASILRAGTYGVEMQLPDGEAIDRVDFATIRPILDAIKPRWASLIENREGYYLEDKEWAIALHGRRAQDDQVDVVLSDAQEIADHVLADVKPRLFRVLGGYKFLEVGPRLAHKGRTVQHLVERYPYDDALLVYFGDDDKDEEAFAVIQEHGGLCVLVSAEERESLADCRLESPAQTRAWLWSLSEMRCTG